MDADTWGGIGPSQITGWGGGYADHGSGGVNSGVDSAVVTRHHDNAPLWNPDNPLFWFGAILLAVTGLVTASVHVKGGPASASVSL